MTLSGVVRCDVELCDWQVQCDMDCGDQNGKSQLHIEVSNMESK